MGSDKISNFSIISKMREIDGQSDIICGVANPAEYANPSYSVLRYDNINYQISSWNICEGCQFMNQLVDHLREVNTVIFCIDEFKDNPLEDVNDFYFDLINRYNSNANKIFVVGNEGLLQGKGGVYWSGHLRVELKRRNCSNYSIIRKKS